MATLAPPPSGRARPSQSWLWRLQLLVSNYLPLLLMAMLASGTWWLVKHTPVPEEATQAPPPRHEPDYQMRNFELQRMGGDGRLRARIEGAALRHYPDTDTLEIDQIHLRSYSADGSWVLARARRAVANADASEIQLYGDVEVKRYEAAKDGAAPSEAKLDIRGEFLQAFVNREQLRSHLPVQLRHGGTTVQAVSFEYDHLNARLSFQGRTTASLAAPGAQKKAKATP
ncbi:LPS export ABC transporter periplasmic protein LptC [Kinneretia aquatilis]|nr:LPS export ABC transporter periplasmic protein LptC [Paucibacter aquatile]